MRRRGVAGRPPSVPERGSNLCRLDRALSSATVASSYLVFGKTDGDRHSLEVEGTPEQVVEALKAGWARLNAAFAGLEPAWVWVNADAVPYVESADVPADTEV